MKIKTTKQMRLDELIKHVWENRCYPAIYKNHMDGEVHFNSIGKLSTVDSYLSMGGMFTVEVAEELTEETVFSNMLIVVQDPETNEKSVLWRIEHNIELSRVRYGQEMLTISAVDEDGKPTLIWSKDTGIPEEGVIEA